ncbi:hypothetical protein A3C24_02220 [Candidatus Roizmanbacteria bacterium RIFCSPHIGHO2_02_FULL_37_24]|uniref:Purple acid phosphatase N-terminal domain-containing protein n=1 Tax=Candidatus Roizmanbacteria bacterium RIFCSPHIGHO2_02_FULL_37_24 TaxID=1802037 RepID=A0A1F7GZW2_9BACT|nr:MAG: hypothetical protein A3C24_02220 [Candidatus Roizmanbacteria bacterium RIFCSPHIGHO2_02_FULL_37_24]OGK60145.1 MAG: hypothetical protein A3G65_02410 [Candidatus Roizmanbacteria bacterium RIFCSPLOWO2_12_FULL_37_7b]
MHYSVLKIQQRKIPSPIALGLIIALSAALTFVLNSTNKPGNEEQKVTISTSEIANLRDNTVSIFWRTSEPSASYIIYGTQQDGLNQQVFDERDKAHNPSIRNNHITTLKDLQADTTYYYEIVINGKKIGQTAQRPFTFKTTRKISSPLDIDPIYGKITDNRGQIVVEGIVILKMGNTYPLITYTKTDGSFLIAPCCIFNSTTLEPYYPSNEQAVYLEIIDEAGNIEIKKTTLADISPLKETIVMDGQEESEKKQLGDTQDREKVSEVLLEAENISKYEDVDIIFPKQGAAIPATKPILKGLGEPGKKVIGQLDPDGKLFEVKVGEDRVWDFALPFELTPGEHTLNVITEDNTGSKLALNRTFTILKSGEAVLGSATPSGTITPQIFPTIAPTALPSLSPIQLTPTSPPPVTGSNITSFAIFSVALVLFGAGMILLF